MPRTKKKETTETKKPVETKENYYTVGQLREALKNVADDVIVVAAPLNDNIRVALDISIVKDTTLGDYKGDVALFTTGLFDIKTGKEISLVPNEQ